MPEFDGTTIGPDGRRVPVEDAAAPDQAVTGAGDEVVEPTQETAESVGYGTAADAVVTGDLPNEAAQAAAEEQQENASAAEAAQPPAESTGTGTESSAEAAKQAEAADAAQAQEQAGN